MSEDPSRPADADSPADASEPLPETEADRKPLEQRETRREKRGKNTLILRELALIAALGLVILAFNLNWGNAEGNRDVAARDTDDIRLRDVRITPPEPDPPEPEPEPEPKRPEPKREVPKNMEREEVPDEQIEEEPEPVETPTVEPIKKMKSSPTQETAEPAPQPKPKPKPKPKPEPPANKVFSQGTADRNAEMIGSLQEAVKYPRRARQANIEGRVILQFVVDESGRAQDIQVLRSPNDMLSDAAVSALKNKKFKPAMQGGQPVKMRMSQPVTFRLN